MKTQAASLSLDSRLMLSMTWHSSGNYMAWFMFVYKFKRFVKTTTETFIKSHKIIYAIVFINYILGLSIYRKSIWILILKQIQVLSLGVMSLQAFIDRRWIARLYVDISIFARYVVNQKTMETMGCNSSLFIIRFLILNYTDTILWQFLYFKFIIIQLS